jgi:hypothetical protein
MDAFDAHRFPQPAPSCNVTASGQKQTSSAVFSAQEYGEAGCALQHLQHLQRA